MASPDDTGPNKNETPDFSNREATEIRRITQPELNVLYRDTKAQLLGSRLKQWNLFEKKCNSIIFRKRQSSTATSYLLDGDLVH